MKVQYLTVLLHGMNEITFMKNLLNKYKKNNLYKISVENLKTFTFNELR